MNYKIVINESVLDDFIQWLPELQDHETYYVTLFSRNKYHQPKSYSAQLKRFISDKTYLLQKIKQLECAVGLYQVKGELVAQESLALYITVNPRDLRKATKKSLIRFAELITEDYNGYNPYQEVLTEIHKAPSRKIYFDFDFDVPYVQSVRSQIENFINIDCVQFLKTKNGFHTLIKTKDIDEKFEKSWYKNISSIPGCDVKGDSLIPVPGCVQGEFSPHFLKD